MIEVLKYIAVTAVAVFIVGTIITLALIPFAVAKGLPSLRKKDVAGFLSATDQVPGVIQTIFVVRRIQSISWVVAAVCSMLLVAWVLLSSPSK